MRQPATFQVSLHASRRMTVRAWPGEGEPLVLLHGLLDSSEGWESLALRTERPCFALDLPGFGGSSLPFRPHIDYYADDVALAMRQLGIERATLVGHSLGGGVAAAVAERLGDIAALVLLAPVGFGRIGIAETLTKPGIVDLATLALPLALINPLTVTAAYATFVAHHRLPDRELLGRLRRRATHAPLAVRAATIAIAEAGREVRGRHPYGGPVAALWGAHDALVPTAHADALRACLPHAHVEFWPGMGHHPQHERPAALAHFVERWGAGRRDDDDDGYSYNVRAARIT
jgi:pimeloyl-ACP methyl ester carboxylesterase